MHIYYNLQEIESDNAFIMCQAISMHLDIDITIKLTKINTRIFLELHKQ